jgi:hypothetical protein
MLVRSGEQHAWLWLAATARRSLLVRAVIDSIDLSAQRRQLVTHALMNGIELHGGQQAFSDTALVAHYDHTETGSVKESNGLDDTRKKLYLLPTGYVLVFGRGFSVNNAVTIEKCGFVHGISSLPPILK